MVLKASSATVQELRAVRKPDSTTVNVVFAHCLQTSRTKPLRRRWKAYLRQLSLPANVRVTSIGFDPSEFLAKGGEKLITLSDCFLKHVRQLSAPTKYIFLAHGIAGWIVKESLSRFDSDALARRSSIIFLGSLHDDSSDWATFTEAFLREPPKDKKLDTSVAHRLDPENIDRAPTRLLRSRTEPFTGANLQTNTSLQTNAFLKNVVDVNFGLMCRRHKPQTEYIVSEDPTVQDDIEPVPIVTRPSDLSGSSSSSRHQFTSEQCMDMALMDIGREPRAKRRIESLLRPTLTRDDPQPVASRTNARSAERFITRNVRWSTGTYPRSEMSSNAMSSRADSFANETRETPSMLVKPRSNHDSLPDTNARQAEDQKRDVHGSIEKDIQSRQAMRPHSRPMFQNDEPERTKLRVAKECHDCGQFEPARRLYEELLSVRPAKPLVEDHQFYIWIGTRIAEIHLQEGRFEKAESDFLKLEGRCRSIGQDESSRLSLEISQWLGVALDKRGHFGKAHEKLTKVAYIARKPDQSTSQNEKESASLENILILTKSTLGLVEAHRGNFSLAKAASEEAANIAKQSSHVSTTSGYNTRISFNSAAIWAYSGNYKIASGINKDVSRKLEKQFGPKNLATLESWSLEVELLAIEGKSDEAEERAEETLKRMRKELGKQHPLTLRLLETLAKIYLSQGRIADAMGTAKYVCGANEGSRALGPTHPQTISSINTLAMANTAAGYLREAEALQLQVVDSSSKYLGEDHPRTMRYQSDLASVYCEMGEWTTSLELTKKVLWRQWEYFLGDAWYSKDVPDHPSNTDIREKLADVKAGRRSLVQAHPSLLSTMHWLGVAEHQRDNGDLPLAKDLIETAIKWRTHVFNDSHADTLASKIELARIQRESGSPKDMEHAFQTLKDIASLRKQNLGDIHPDTLSTRHEIGVTLFLQGEVQAATKEHSMVLKLRQRILGDFHPHTIRSQRELARGHQNLGNLDKAEELLLSALKAQARQTGLLGLDLSRLNADKKAQRYASILQKFFGDSISSEEFVSKAPDSIAYYSDVISTVSDLVSLYVEQDGGAKLNTAALVQEDIVVLRELCLGLNTIETLQAVNYLALIYQAQERDEDAIAHYDRVQRHTQEDHSLHLAAQSNLASLYFSHEEFETAEEIQSTVVKMLNQCQPKNLKGMIEGSFNLALMQKERTLRQGTSPQAAMQLMTEVKDLSEQLGHMHPLHISMYDTWKEWTQEIDELEGQYVNDS